MQTGTGTMLGGTPSSQATSRTSLSSVESKPKIHSSCVTGGPRPPPFRKALAGPSANPCPPCGGTGDPMTPVYGRYGSYFDPTLLKKAQVVTRHRPKKLVREISLKNKKKMMRQELMNRLFPLAPKPYVGPYHNIMWDPHVRRGPTLVHFSELEKVCPIPPKGSWASIWKNRKYTPTTKHPLFRTRGCPIYPDVALGHKLDLADFSQFLEEQDDGRGPLKDTETQTEDPIGPIPKKRNNYNIGYNVSTQADYFHIATEMRPAAPNPITQTIRSISSVMKMQIISQSLLENGEASELGQIRGQADALELWIAKEQMRLAKADRDLCKKIERMKREADLEAEWEKRFEELRKRVGAGIFAACFAKSVVEGAFANLERIGVIGADKEAEGIRDYLHNAVAEIVIKNREIAYNLLDDIIEEANRIGPGGYPSFGGGLNDDNSEGSEEGGLSFSTGKFEGESRGEGDFGEIEE